MFKTEDLKCSTELLTIEAPNISKQTSPSLEVVSSNPMMSQVALRKANMTTLNGHRKIEGLKWLRVQTIVSQRFKECSQADGFRLW